MASMVSDKETNPNPFVGPRPFKRGETLYGRDRERTNLRYLLIAERILLLYSPSGAGKTSLIQAALIPDMLNREKFQVLPVMRVNLIPPSSVQGDSADTITPDNRYIFSLLLSLEKDLPHEKQLPEAELAGMGLADYLNERLPSVMTATTSAGNGGGKGKGKGNVNYECQLLIFDQFEEVLTLDPTDQEGRQAFFEQVAEVLRDRNRWALFSLREDYLAALDPYRRSIPTRLKNRFRLDLLSERDAQLAIQQPNNPGGEIFTDAAAIKLVNELRTVQVQQPDGAFQPKLGQYIEPVQLQVVCDQLWKKTRLHPGPIEEKDIEDVKDVDSALASYYNERVEEIASQTKVSERSIRDWFDNKLITKDGVRWQVLQTHGKSEGLDNQAILAFVDAHLVRKDDRRGATWYELAHDRLINPVREANRLWREKHYNTLQQQAALWESEGKPETPRNLLRRRELLEAERWAKDHEDELTSGERDFLAKCSQAQKERQRQRYALIGVGMLVVATMLGLIIFFRQQAELKGQRLEVEGQRLELAVKNANLSQATAIIAVQQQALVQQQATAVAQRQQVTALAEQRSLARSRQLASQAFNHLDDQLDLALLLSVEAERADDTIEADDSLLTGLQHSPYLTAFLGRHIASVRSVAFSPDGKVLASGSCGQLDNFGQCNRGEVRLWDVLAHQPISPTLNGHNGSVYGVAFSPDGKALASVSEDKSVILWDIAGRGPIGQPLRVPSHTLELRSEVRSVAFSPDGKTLAVGSKDGAVYLWDVTGASVANIVSNRPPDFTLKDQKDQAPVSWVMSLAFSPDGKVLASGDCGNDAASPCKRGEVRLWDVGMHLQIGQPLVRHGSYVRAVAFSPDGKTLVSGGDDGNIIFWDVSGIGSGSEPTGQSLHSDLNPVLSLAFSPDSKTLAVGGCVFDRQGQKCARGEVQVWDAATRKPREQPFTGHAETVRSVAFSPDGKTLASGGDDKAIILWDLDRRYPIGRPVNGDKAGAQAKVAFSLDGKTLASGGCAAPSSVGACAQGEIRLLNTTTLQPLGQPLTGHQASVESLAFSPNGKTLASGSGDQSITLWDLRPTVPLNRTLSTRGTPVQSLAFSLDGKKLATVGGNEINIWDVGVQYQPLLPITTDMQYLTSVVFSPDSKTLAAGGCVQIVAGLCDQGEVRLWNIATRQQVGTLGGHASQVSSIAFSPDGALLASGSCARRSDSGTNCVQGDIRLWNAATYQPRNPDLIGDVKSVGSLAFSPDSKTLASAGTGGITLWNLQLNLPLGSLLPGFAFQNTTQGTSPDEAPFPQVVNETSSVAFSPDGKTLASGHPSGPPILWDVQPQHWIEAACAMANRNFTPVEWRQYMGDATYRQTCLGLVTGGQ